MTSEQTKKLRDIKKSIEIIAGYGKFTEGQDGFAALLIIRKSVNELLGEVAPYGFCPHCGKPGIARERSPDGNDTCEGGHVYPSRLAR